MADDSEKSEKIKRLERKARRYASVGDAENEGRMKRKIKRLKQGGS